MGLMDGWFWRLGARLQLDIIACFQGCLSIRPRGMVQGPPAVVHSSACSIILVGLVQRYLDPVPGTLSANHLPARSASDCSMRT